MKKFLAAAVGLLTFCAASSFAHANVVTYDFTGTVNVLIEAVDDTVNDPASSILSGPLVSDGELVHGRISFDTTPISTVMSPSGMSADYQLTVSSELMLDDTGTAIGWSSRPGQVQVSNNEIHGADIFTFTVAGNDGPNLVNFTLGLSNQAGTAWDSTALDQALLLAAFPDASLNYSWASSEGTLNVSAILTSFTREAVSPVPEEGTLPMMLAGLSMVGLLSHRRGLSSGFKRLSGNNAYA